VFSYVRIEAYERAGNLNVSPLTRQIPEVWYLALCEICTAALYVSICFRSTGITISRLLWN